MENYQFVNKTIYLPKQKILVIGDMHLGYEFTFREAGSQIPALQLNQTKEDLEKIFLKLKKEKKGIKKVIFLGDIKHLFHYEKGEKNIILNVLLLVGKYVKRENIILIKGNHEKMAQIADKELLEFYVEEDIAFIHGDIIINEVFKKEIKIIIMGHLHPAITISDSQKIKKEKYKCFLVGKYKNKEIIILPSFLPIIEGTSVNEHLSNNRCFIPAKNLLNFKVHVVGEKDVLDFGVLKNL